MAIAPIRTGSGVSAGGDIRVALADDHELFRDGMSAILGLAAGIAVVGEASDAEGAVAIASLHLPDILLLDVEMPGPPIATTLRRLRRGAPPTRVIVLTMHRDRVLRDELHRAGAAAFMTKSTPSAELIDVIRQVAHAPVRPSSAIRPPGIPAESVPQSGPLSPRENEVIRLIALAHTNAEIAARLSITVGTVKRHTGNLYRKLGATSRMDAVRKATVIGILADR